MKETVDLATPHKPQGAAPLLQVDADVPPLSATESLNGWHREFCVELLGEGAARVFVRSVRQSSFKASELLRGILFLRLDPRFSDLPGCVSALQKELKNLAATAQRMVPNKANLYITLDYKRNAWERVEEGVERWARGRNSLAPTARR